MMTPAFFLALASLASNGGANEPAPKPLTLVPIVQDEDEANKPWAGSLLIGITDTTGNSSNFTAAATADAVLEREHYRITFAGYLHKVETEQKFDDDNNGLNDRKESVVTERKVGLSGQYDYLTGEDHYYFLKTSASKDKSANIELRYFGGAGVGYDFIKKDDLKFSVESGLSYFSESYRKAAPGAATSEDSLALIFGYDLDHTLSEHTSLTQKFEAFPAIDDFHDVFMRLDTRLTMNLTENMVGSIQYLLEFDNTPATDGTVEAPLDVVKERLDRVLAISVGWSFGG